jgi:hypothetical protein
MLAALNDKIEGLQTPVGSGIPEVYHFNSIVFDETDDVIPGKIVRRLFQETDQWIGVQIYTGFFHI